jgi:hypothetical protein
MPEVRVLRAHTRSRITTPSPVSGVGVPSIYAFANGAAGTWCGTPPPRTLTGVICAEVELSAFPTRTSSSSMRVHTVKGSRYDLRSSTPRSDCCRQSVALDDGHFGEVATSSHLCGWHRAARR